MKTQTSTKKVLTSSSSSCKSSDSEQKQKAKKEELKEIIIDAPKIDESVKQPEIKPIKVKKTKHVPVESIFDFTPDQMQTFKQDFVFRQTLAQKRWNNNQPNYDLFYYVYKQKRDKYDTQQALKKEKVKALKELKQKEEQQNVEQLKEEIKKPIKQKKQPQNVDDWKDL